MVVATIERDRVMVTVSIGRDEGRKVTYAGRKESGLASDYSPAAPNL